MRRAADYNAYFLFAFLCAVLVLVGLLLAASVAKAAVPVRLRSTPSFALTPCSGERFTDVCPGEYFYTAVLSLNDSGIVSGYTTSPPCPDAHNTPCFLPYRNVSRGQTAKIVSLVAGFNDPVSGQTFTDVPPGSAFYVYVERIVLHRAMSGYPCGGPGEPCCPSCGPYFRPNGPITRGQLSKVIVVSFGWADPIGAQQFEDVAPNSTFFTYIGQLYNRHIATGYPCGGPGEPCGTNNLPYFRPNAGVTRGQAAKVVHLARIWTGPTATPTASRTIIATPTRPTTNTPTATPTCCHEVMASITAVCNGTQYHSAYTITNSCPITVTASGWWQFEVSPNYNGPWQPILVGDCFSCPISPGSHQYDTSLDYGPLPTGNNWWRVHISYFGNDGCWYFNVASEPQPACVLPTTTPSPITEPSG